MTCDLNNLNNQQIFRLIIVCIVIEKFIKSSQFRKKFMEIWLKLVKYIS